MEDQKLEESLESLQGAKNEDNIEDSSLEQANSEVEKPLIHTIVLVEDDNNILEKCLESLKNQKSQNFQVTVVVSQKATQSIEFLCGYNDEANHFDYLIYEATPQSMINDLIDSIKADYLHIIAPNEIVLKDSYNSLVDTLNKQADIICFSSNWNTCKNPTIELIDESGEESTGIYLQACNVKKVPLMLGQYVIKNDVLVLDSELKSVVARGDIISFIERILDGKHSIFLDKKSYIKFDCDQAYYSQICSLEEQLRSVNRQSYFDNKYLNIHKSSIMQHIKMFYNYGYFQKNDDFLIADLERFIKSCANPTRKVLMNDFVNTAIDAREIRLSEKPIVSVIIPIYNATEFLHLCLDSVIYQSFSDIEIICIDKGSTDNSTQILRNYQKKDSRIKVYKQKYCDDYVAQKFGISKAKGEYLLFLNASDFLEKNVLEKFYAVRNNSEADFYVFGYSCFNNKNHKVVEDVFTTTSKDWKSILMEDNKTLLYQEFEKRAVSNELQFQPIKWNKIYSFNYIDKIINKKLNDEESIEDRVFHYSTLAHAEKIVCVATSLVSHRTYIDSSSMFDSKSNILESQLLAYNLVMREMVNEELKTKAEIYKDTVANIFEILSTTSAASKWEVFKQFMDFINETDLSAYNEIIDDSKEYLKLKILLDQKYLLGKDSNKIIPIAFATNDNYAPYLSVAIQSLINNSNKDLFYDIYVLHSSLSESTIEKLEGQDASNTHIKCLNVSKLINDNLLKTKDHISKETFYRFLIPEILFIYDKVLYLDCDIVCLDDVANLYNINLENNIIGGIKNPLVDYVKKHVESLNLSVDSYINAGVMIIDSKLFKKELIKQKCFNLLSMGKKYKFLDQDILNILCKNRVKFIAQNWNFQWHHIHREQDQLESISKQVLGEYFKAKNSIKILHFTSDRKPWIKPELPLAYHFWNAAKDSPFYEEIVYNNIINHKKIKDAIAKNNPIKVSIVVPVYNTAPFLRECLNGIKNQTLKDIEIICIDDGSTDNSYKILQDYAKNDSRFIIATQKNQGAAVARNKGLAIARGEYIAFLDSDDMYNKKMIEKMYNKSKKFNTDITICRANTYFQKLKKIKECEWALNMKAMPKKDVFSALDIKDRVFTAINAWPIDKLFKTSFIKLNDLKFQPLTNTNDLYFVCSALSKANRISIVNEVLITSRRGQENNTTARRAENYMVFLDAYVALRDELIKSGWFDSFERSFINRVMNTAIWQYGLVKAKKHKKKIHRFLRKKVFKIFEFAKYQPSFFFKKAEYDKYIDIRHNISPNIFVSKLYNFLSWPIRMPVGFLKCLRDNGWKYTMSRIKAKFAYHLKGEKS